jgi:hypothetical protein
LTVNSSTLEPTLTAPAVTLTSFDRCDACGSRAYVQVGVATKDSDEQLHLLFCGHHYTVNEPALAANKAVRHISDQRHILVEAERTRNFLDPEPVGKTKPNN